MVKTGAPASAGLRRGRQAVNSEPEERSTAEIIAILHKWGIHTLGQLAALNKEELRDRLGSEAVRLWERANGTAIRLLKLVQPPESFDESFEFDHEIETAEPLLFILRRFLEQLALRLSSIYLVARELTLRITFSDSLQVRYETDSANWLDEPAVAGKKNYERIFKIPQPTNEVDLLFRMLQTHLENFKSEHPIVAVALSAEPIRPVLQQFGLFETTLRNPQQLYETLARLTALLGSDHVGTPVLEETHRPDAFRMEAFDWSRNDECRMTNDEGNSGISAAKSFDDHPPSSDSGLARTPKAFASGQPATTEKRRQNDECRMSIVETKPALRRFRPAAFASVFNADNVPVHIQSEKTDACAVDAIRGPFLLSGNWWDERAWARAEWDMQLENLPAVATALQAGSVIVRAHEASGAWRIDGIYD